MHLVPTATSPALSPAVAPPGHPQLAACSDGERGRAGSGVPSARGRARGANPTVPNQRGAAGGAAQDRSWRCGVTTEPPWSHFGTAPALGQRGSCRSSAVGDMQGHHPVAGPLQARPVLPGPQRGQRQGQGQPEHSRTQPGGNPLSRGWDTGRGTILGDSAVPAAPAQLPGSRATLGWRFPPARSPQGLQGSTVQPWELARGCCLLPMAPRVALPRGVAY